jgi:hypothetical protein
MIRKVVVICQSLQIDILSMGGVTDTSKANTLLTVAHALDIAIIITTHRCLPNSFRLLVVKIRTIIIIIMEQ